MRTGRPKTPIDERLANRLLLDPETGCWNWDRPNKAGYGIMGDENRKSVLAHRISYELYVGDIPEGYEVHHECENTRCCFFKHLKAFGREGHRAAHAETRTECINGHKYVEGSFVIDRGARRCVICRREREKKATEEYRKLNPPKPHPNLGKTHCKRGHEFTEKNTYITNAGSRQCKECMAFLKKRWLDKQPAKEVPAVKYCKHGHAKTPENTYTYKGRASCIICIKARHVKSRAKTLFEPTGQTGPTEGVQSEPIV